MPDKSRDAFKALLDRAVYYREHLLNYGSFIFFRVLTLGLYALATSLFINRAGEERFGLLALFLVFYNFLSILDLGFGYALNYRIARSIARQRREGATVRLLRKGLPFYFAAALIGFLLIFGPAEVYSRLLFDTDAYAGLVRIMAGSVALLMFDAIFLGVIQAFNKVYIVNLSRFIFDAWRSLALLIGAFFEGDLRVVLGLIVVGSAVKLGFGVYFCSLYIKARDWLRPIFNWRDIWLNLRFGGPMVVTTVVGLLIANLDKIYIGKIISREQLAYYSIAFEINAKAWFFIYAINSSLYTVLLRRSSRQAGQRDLILISFASILLLGICYYLPVSLFAYEILEFWISADFARQTHELVPVLALSSLIYLAGSVFYNLLQTARQITLLALANLATLGALVFLIGHFSPLYSSMGVAISYPLAYGLLLVILGIVAWRRGLLAAGPKNPSA